MYVLYVLRIRCSVEHRRRTCTRFLLLARDFACQRLLRKYRGWKKRSSNTLWRSVCGMDDVGVIGRRGVHGGYMPGGATCVRMAAADWWRPAGPRASSVVWASSACFTAVPDCVCPLLVTCLFLNFTTTTHTAIFPISLLPPEQRTHIRILHPVHIHTYRRPS